jgi:single-stranded DNA-specific DHH superfamily exonuclease
MKQGKQALILVVLASLVVNPASAYFRKFHAENSGTRKARGTLNKIFSPNTTIESRFVNNDRSFSHVLLVGTPNFITKSSKKANQAALELKEKMIEKKKKQKKIEKELAKHPYRYSKVLIPDWDRDPGISMFLTALNESTKVPVDFNIVDAKGNIACSAKSKLKAIRINAQDANYIEKTYLIYGGSINSDTLHVKYYADPECLVSDKAQMIVIEYTTKNGKPIYISQDMDNFKDGILNDFGMLEKWAEDHDI